MEVSGRKQFELDLRKGIKGDVSFRDFTLGIYATDASIYQIRPVALVVPLDAKDVVHAVKTALAHNVSILPRGGGTSLGGQATGSSMVIDFSKYMNRVLEINVRERWARVQPGLVLDELNSILSRTGLHFAPDPATGSRATIGGMIGNNASGTRSIVYGLTRDHILETKVLLSDGTVHTFRDILVNDYLEGPAGKNEREYRLVSVLKGIVDRNRDEIIRRYPKTMRRVQGYNLDAYVNTGIWNLSGLIAGSEGTLGIVLESKINLEPLPGHKILCTVHFKDMQEAIRSVPRILEHKPSALEILDEEVIRRARENRKTAPMCGFIKGNPGGILIVEFFGDTAQEVRAKTGALSADLQAAGTGYHWPVLEEPAGQAMVWNVRKDGLGLLYGIKGERKPLAFIEDASLPLDALPEYVDRVLKFCRSRDVPVVIYAHASVGLLHLRPVLNLKQQADIDHMKAIAEYSFGLVRKYGGSVSGEHGDGRVRSPFLEKFFGPRVYGAFREVKQLFDPAGIMNPGVIVDPGPMDSNLRYGRDYKTPAFATQYHYRDEGSFAAAVEMCNGVGDCRQNLKGIMCPSYRVTRDEEHSTRGRANALRLAMTGQMGEDAFTSQELFGIMDLCISCKGCKSECPSSVDMAKLKGEFLQNYHRENGTGLRERLVAGSAGMAARMAGWKAPLVNRLQKTMLFRRSLQRLAGIDSRRVLPFYAKKPFRKWFAGRPGRNGHYTGKVVLFDDTYMNHHETSVGISAVELLESCGYEVILAKAGCCQRPRISHGFLEKAGAEGEKTLRRLKEFIDEGLKIVVCEPGCASALTDDLPDLIEDVELGRLIRENVMMIDVFLAREIESGRIDRKFSSAYRKIMIHGHCHQKSLYGTDAMKTVLERIPGLSVEVLDTGCCGMAGSFGYEKEHYDLSLKMGEDRLFPAVRGKEETTAVVACGFSCRHQIAHGTGVEARHWVEVFNAGT